MNSSPVDVRMSMDQAAQNDLVQRKVAMDSLRKRLGDTATKEEKLRESCEGFEAVFIQKMWEQMRKNVGKGYLHSKDEETYQSLFDVELSKKMASAGGIGLADMLYEQLSQKLTDTGRTTSPGTYRNAAPLAPLDMPGGTTGKNETAMSAGVAMNATVGKPTTTDLKAEQLYSALPEEGMTERDTAAESASEAGGEHAGERSSLAQALAELRSELETGSGQETNGVTVPEVASIAGVFTPPATQTSALSAGGARIPTAPGQAADAVSAQGGRMSVPAVARQSESSSMPSAERPAALSAMTNSPGKADPDWLVSTRTPEDLPAMTAAQAAAQRYGRPAAADGPVRGDNTAPPARKAVPATEELGSVEHSRNAALSSSWQGVGPVSVKPRPINVFGRSKGKRSDAAGAKGEASAQPPRGMVPQETLWPVGEKDGRVTGSFGWEDDPATGKRRWNPGVEIATAPGTPVRASLDGTVVFSGEQEGAGALIVLEHRNGFRSYYGNVGDISVKEGDMVPRGMVFAKTLRQPSASGEAENAAPLHFEFKRGEMSLNPESAILRAAMAEK